MKSQGITKVSSILPVETMNVISSNITVHCYISVWIRELDLPLSNTIPRVTSLVNNLLVKSLFRKQPFKLQT